MLRIIRAARSSTLILRPNLKILYSPIRFLSTRISDEDIANARVWLQNFTPESIPQNSWKITYSRSSGPGGQNVNKVNSKATLRVPVAALLPHIPKVIHSTVRESSYYAKKSDDLVFQNDENRHQNLNAKACYSLLFDLLKKLTEEKVPGETSEGQKIKVLGLKEAENEKRLKFKKMQSQKKAMRSSRGNFE